VPVRGVEHIGTPQQKAVPQCPAGKGVLVVYQHLYISQAFCLLDISRLRPVVLAALESDLAAKQFNQFFAY